MTKRGVAKPSKPLTRRRRLLVTFVSGAVALASVGVWIVYGTSAFAVESVVVRGSEFTGSAKVRQAAAIAEGTAVAAIDTDAAARRVSAIPSVEKAAVDRDWPHGVVITITERTPRLAVPKGEKFTLVDDAGVAFRTVSKQPPKTVTAEVDHPERDDAATMAVLEVLENLSQRLENELVSVKAPTPSRVELTLRESRTVFWGDSSDSARKAEVATALLDRSEKHLDVSAPDVPTVS
ncbi:MAG: cell division protein FtsQ/DivIB [Stackebrandtia sp.]